MPTASSQDAAIAAALDLTKALQNPSPASALSPLSDNHHHALTQLAEIFNTATARPTNNKSTATAPPPGFDPVIQEASDQPRVEEIPTIAAPINVPTVKFADSTVIQHAEKPRV